MIAFLNQLVDPTARRLASSKKIVLKINQLEPDTKSLTDTDLYDKTIYFKDLLKNGKSLDEILPEVFAVVREAIFRTLGERAYDVQLQAAITLHQGSIAEQKTGEGKTHSVIFAAYLNALLGKGVHIVTPNDYLSQVGAGWYPRALHKLGLTTGCIIHEQSFIFDPNYKIEGEPFDERLSHLRPVSRKEAYLCDLTYGTNNEFGFDYLRDHMVNDSSQLVQKEHYFAIVDEVDFVLIDEARTPLIISSPDNRPIGKYQDYANLVEQLQSTDYAIDEKTRSANLTEYGIRKVERLLGIHNLYEESFDTIHYIENAIKAKALFKKDKDYVIKDGQIVIVDEFTGRLMNGRRWSDGLHQAVEAKEGVQIQQESRTWATITFQNYFRLYSKLAGMTGTAATEAEEFRKIYNLEVIPIPTHRPTKRQDTNDLIFKTQRAKYAAIASQVESLYATGQPVLIGTTSVEKNQIVSSLLSKKKIPHQVLNAKNHLAEAEIISKAGTKGTVTVATNMAGRGVDIILGGPKPEDKTSSEIQNEWQKKHEEVIALGGLYVIGTERHESRRIDNQLRGRAGRQGDPGKSQFYVALDDDLMRIFGGEKIAGVMTRMNMPEDEAISHPMVSRILEQTQIKVEGFHFDTRKNVVEYDDVVNKQRQIVYQIRDGVVRANLENPAEVTTQIQKYLQKQLDFIFSANTNLASGSIDFSRIIPEFNEILPLDDTARLQLAKKVESELDPKTYLLALLQNANSEREKIFGPDLALEMGRYCILSTLDPLWVDHLTALDDLRNGVRLRGYAQKDPLVEYRKEGFEMFQALMRQFEYNVCRKIFRLQPTPIDQNRSKVSLSEGRGEEINSHASVDQPQNIVLPKIEQAKSSHPELGRNDPCWCGSGKKYKKCHWPN